VKAIKFGVILLLSVVTGGRVDYSPECNRPWTVDFRDPRRYPGRGFTLREAWGMHFRKRSE